MTQDTAKIQNIRPDQGVMSQDRPWLRQDGESSLWFNRFRRYMNLGPKRSLQAAVEQERSQIVALKSTKQATVPDRKNKKSVDVQIQALPQPKIQVPGSWKAACKTWQWVERAKVYDNRMVDRYVDIHIEAMYELQYTNSAGRLSALNSLFGAAQELFNCNSKKMTFEQLDASMARMQSVLRDIRDEMKIYDESVTRFSLRYTASEKYTAAFAKEDKKK